MDSQQAYQICWERLNWVSKQLAVEIDSNHLSEIAELIVQPMTGYRKPITILVVVVLIPFLIIVERCKKWKNLCR